MEAFIHSPWVPKPARGKIGIRTQPTELQSLCRVKSRKQGSQEARLLPQRLPRAQASAQTQKEELRWDPSPAPRRENFLGAASGRGKRTPQTEGTRIWKCRSLPGPPARRMGSQARSPAPAPPRLPRALGTHPWAKIPRLHVRARAAVTRKSISTRGAGPVRYVSFRGAAVRGARLPWKPRPWRRPGWEAAPPSAQKESSRRNHPSPPERQCRSYPTCPSSCRSRRGRLQSRPTRTCGSRSVRVGSLGRPRWGNSGSPLGAVRLGGRASWEPSVRQEADLPAALQAASPRARGQAPRGLPEVTPRSLQHGSIVRSKAGECGIKGTRWCGPLVPQSHLVNKKESQVLMRSLLKT